MRQRARAARRRAVLIIAALILGLLTAILGVALGVFRDVRKRLPENRYGLCSGSSDMRPDRAGVLPLTDWLHDFFQNLAGSTPTDDPVTFGDLWGNGGDENAPARYRARVDDDKCHPRHLAPLSLPRRELGTALFRQGRIRRLVSEIRRGLDESSTPAEIRHGDSLEVPEGFHPIPKPPDLPILLGARMSLSFPVLLSAVPLYAANFERAPENGKYPLERCWFSDGGLDQQLPDPLLRRPSALTARPSASISCRTRSRPRKSMRPMTGWSG